MPKGIIMPIVVIRAGATTKYGLTRVLNGITFKLPGMAAPFDFCSGMEAIRYLLVSVSQRTHN
jgi:hypothetical protein